VDGQFSKLGHFSDADTSENYSYIGYLQKPVEVYVFIDPLCPECWSLEPYFKKLSIEYGRFFTIKTITTGELSCISTETGPDQPQKLRAMWEKTAKRTGMSCDGDIWIENPITSPYLISLAIKAAELQGKRAGRVYLRKLQECAFLHKQNISDESVLIACAHEANIDADEFKNDLHSDSAKRAYESDLKLTWEMEVDFIPTMVFINHRSEEQGIKISGIYPYDIYELVLQETLQINPIPSSKPPLEDFLKFYQVVSEKEVAVVYDWSLERTEKEMKKLMFQKRVERKPVKYGSFWKYIGQRC
jgi:predicted DsbA family dithiol-disulfide isomerase